MNKTHMHPLNPAKLVYGRALGPDEKTRVGDVFSSKSGMWEPVPCFDIVMQNLNGAIIVRPAKEEGPIQTTTALIMQILEGHATENAVEELQSLSLRHHQMCSLGGVPACTCGHIEAQNFLKLLDGTIRKKQLIRPSERKSG